MFGLLILGFLGFLVFITVSAIIGAVIAWRVIAPDSRHFRLRINHDGIRVYTEKGEVVRGSVLYKNTSKNLANLVPDKPKRHLILGDDGELEDVELFDESAQQDTSSRDITRK